jgi:hypothetical protein
MARSSPRRRLAALMVAAAAAQGARAQIGRVGSTLELQTCASTPLQVWQRPGDGTIVHTQSGLCVEAFGGNDYGWDGKLVLLPCLAGHAAQQWAVDTSPPPNGGTLRNNVTAIIGCLGWNVWTSNYAAGDEVGAYGCSPAGQAPAANEVFVLDAAFTGAIQPYGPTPGGGPTTLCVAVAVPTGAYTLDDSLPGAPGPVYDGLGIVAGAGSARLLFDYAEPTRSNILRSIFGPPAAGGLGINMLKVEVGGDGDGTMGSEPSHQHVPNEPSGAAIRGHQVWLAAQAKAINPAIKLYALPWSWPGWLRVGKDDKTPFMDPFAAATYVADWLTGVQAGVGVTFDYVGVFSDIWDDDLSPAYVQTLRVVLDGAGFSAVAIVCADVNDWQCAKAALATPALAAAVGVLGDHGFPGTQDANMTGLPLWLAWTSNGAANTKQTPGLVTTLNSAFVEANLTATLVYAAFGGSTHTFPEWNSAAVRCDAPWSGYWAVTPLWYALAHTSQFVPAGWNFLTVASGGSGKMVASKGSYVTRYSGSQWTTVITKTTGGASAELATFTLGGAFANTPVAYLWTTCFGFAGSVNVSFMQGPTTVTPSASALTLWLLPNCLYTLTSVAGAGQPPALPPTAVPTGFPLSYADDFSGRAVGAPGKYWSDVNGAFEVVSDPVAGTALQQKAMSTPITRRNTSWRPHTVLGDANWRDIDFTGTFLLTSRTDVAAFAVRVNNFNDTAGIDGTSGLDDGHGVWLMVNYSGWNLTSDLKPDTAPWRTGLFSSYLQVSTWYPLRLVARGNQAVGIINSALLFNAPLNAAPGFPTVGAVALGAGAFGHTPMFGAFSFAVSRTTCSDTPAEGDMPHEEACQAGTPGQSLTFLPGPGGPSSPGQFALAANATLCVQTNGSSDPQYRYQNTRAITLQVCNASEPRQFFLPEATAVDGPYDPIGPLQGVDGLAVNVYGNEEKDDSDVSSYPWQGGTNAYWYWDAPTGSLFANFMGTCLSFCSKL